MVELNGRLPLLQFEQAIIIIQTHEKPMAYTQGASEQVYDYSVFTGGTWPKTELLWQIDFHFGRKRMPRFRAVPVVGQFGVIFLRQC